MCNQKVLILDAFSSPITPTPSFFSTSCKGGFVISFYSRQDLGLVLQSINVFLTIHKQSHSPVYSFLKGTKIEPTVQESDRLVVPFNFRGSKIEDVLCQIKGDTVTISVADITGANNLGPYTYHLPSGADYRRGSAYLLPADGGYVLLVLTGFQRPDISITWEKPFISGDGLVAPQQARHEEKSVQACHNPKEHQHQQWHAEHWPQLLCKRI